MQKNKNSFFVALSFIFSLSFFSFTNSVLAADINFAADTGVLVNNLNLVVLSGSGASAPLTTGNTTLSVVTPAATTFTLTSPEGFTLTNNRNLVQTCDGDTTRVVVSALTSVIFSPTPVIFCPGGDIPPILIGGEPSRVTVSSSANNIPTPGCAPGDAFSATTGERCRVIPIPPVGCGNGNAFSPATGQSCGLPPVPEGCGNGNAFSPVNGQSCGVVTGTGGTTTVVITSPTGPFSYAFGTATVRLGSSGAGCMAWQNFFNNRTNAGLVVDGKCGPLTMAAARSWQASSGLVADGLLGANSRAEANRQALLK